MAGARKANAADLGVTVVIPAFRAKDTIVRAVESVATQRGIEPEILVIVDDQCEETRERAERLGVPGCRVIMNERNLGGQETRNRGLAEASQPFITFLDGDDFMSGNLLRGQIDAAMENEADLVLGPWRRLTSAGQLLPIQVPQPASAEAVFCRWLVDRIWVPPSAVLWRTDYVRSIGGWNPKIRRNQDGEIALRAIASGARLAFSTEGAGVYDQHDSEHRVTRSTTNRDSLLDVADSLLSIDGTIPKSVRTQAISRYLYDAAADAVCAGYDEFAKRALARSRELGFRGKVGPMRRIGCRLLGFRNYHRLRGYFFNALRRLQLRLSGAKLRQRNQLSAAKR